MSDISKSSSSSKRRIHQIDDTIEYLTHEVKKLKDFVYKTEFECSLMTVKLKREKVKALSAVARSQVLLADMDVLIAESDLFADIERLKNFKKIKLDRDDDEGKSSKGRSKEPTATTNTASVQTTNSQAETKKKRKHSSSRKSPVNISSDETVLIPTIYESTASHLENPQTLPTSFSPGMLDKVLENKSDSEVSLSSSIRAEFSEPYNKSQDQEPENKRSNKKQKSNREVDAKTKSKQISKPKPTQSPTNAIKTVADLRKSVNTPPSRADVTSTIISTPKNSSFNSGDRNATACTSNVPIRPNMPTIITQPSMYVTHPSIYVNPATQTSMQYHSQRGNIQAYNFYGSNQ